MEKRDEKQIEREKDLWEKERVELVTMRVWGLRREKSKGKREKIRELTMRERRCQKIKFPAATNEYNIYRRCNTWEREIVFQKEFLENSL